VRVCCMKQKWSGYTCIVTTGAILRGKNLTRRSPNVETIARLIDQSSFLFTTYDAECGKNAASRGTEFWRGNISGFRYAVGEIYGREVIHGVLENVRTKTGLEIPPVGELDAQGKFLGPDSEADF
jgi:hypothetical protein